MSMITGMSSARGGAHDDIDLSYGTMRVHHSRGSGGHNGIKSVAATLGTTEFWRLRIGVGRPPGRMDPADFVLQRFRPEEDADILIQEAADVLEAFARFHAKRFGEAVLPVLRTNLSESAREFVFDVQL